MNHRVTIELTDKMGLNIGSVHSILVEDLAMQRLSSEICGKAVNDGAETISPESHIGHAVLHKQ